MTDPQPTRLLTRAQVIAKLREERGLHGLTVTANRYGIKAQQLCDVLAGRAALSKRMAERVRYKLHLLYEHLEEGE